MSDKQLEGEITFLLNYTIKTLKRQGLSGIQKINSLIKTDQESRPIVDFIFSIVCDEYGLEKEAITKPNIRGITVFARKLVICFLYEHTDLSVSELSRQLQRHRQIIHAEKREINELSRSKKMDSWFFEKYDKLQPIIEKYKLEKHKQNLDKKKED